MKFSEELKRRNVIKASIAYLVVNWVLLQLLSILLPIVDAPDWVMKTLTLLMVLGFPIWVIISWVYEITPEGLKKTTNVPEDLSITAKTNKRLNILIIIGLIAAIAVSFINRSDSMGFPSKSSKLLGDNSIAVLPFKDMSSEDTEWFCDGVTDNILNHLSQIKEFTVISRTSSDTYKGSNKTIPEIAKELGVSYIVEGSVTKHNNKVKIIAQLINANDEHIWSKDYDDNFDDIFTIQKNVAQQIAQQLKINLTPKEEERISYIPTNNLEALKLYQKGRSLADDRTKTGLESSIVYYKKATTTDPDYAEAYAEIANSYLLMGYYRFMNLEESNNEVNVYIEKALTINPNSVRAYTVKAMFFVEEKKWDKAKEYFEKAIALNPNDATAHHHFATYYREQNIPDNKNFLIEANIAQRLDPLSNVINALKIQALVENGKIQEAEDHYDKISFILNDEFKKFSKRVILSKKIELIIHEKKDWSEAIKYLHNQIQIDSQDTSMYIELAIAYQQILYDNVNYLKYTKIAYEIDPTKLDIAREYFYALLANKKYIEAERLMNNNYKNDSHGDLELYDKVYYYFKYKDYDRALEIAQDPLLIESISLQLKSYVFAIKGDVKGVRKILNMEDILEDYDRYRLFAILKERDSMYYYLEKEMVYIRYFNASSLANPYRKEERYKALLKKNYLPITHWNE